MAGLRWDWSFPYTTRSQASAATLARGTSSASAGIEWMWLSLLMNGNASLSRCRVVVSRSMERASIDLLNEDQSEKLIWAMNWGVIFRNQKRRGFEKIRFNVNSTDQHPFSSSPRCPRSPPCQRSAWHVRSYLYRRNNQKVFERHPQANLKFTTKWKVTIHEGKWKGWTQTRLTMTYHRFGSIRFLGARLEYTQKSKIVLIQVMWWIISTIIWRPKLRERRSTIRNRERYYITTRSSNNIPSIWYNIK
jgi:hypothetical protein